jgi:hypothetical protein
MTRLCLLAALATLTFGCDGVTTLSNRPGAITAEDHLSISASPRDAPLPAAAPPRVAAPAK